MGDERVQPEVSLLQPAGVGPGENGEILAEHAGVDVGLQALIERMSFPQHLRPRLRSILLAPVFNLETIRYRQEILEDFLNNPLLQTQFEVLLPRLAHLGYLSDYPYHTFLEQVTTRLGELELYIECVRFLDRALGEAENQLRSRGLLRLREQVRQRAADEAFQDLETRLPELRKKASGVVSITIGINLDPQLRPNEATLLSLNDRPFSGARDTFLSRLLGERREAGPVKDDDDYRGIAQLHRVPEAFLQAMQQGGQRPNPLMFPIFQDLDQIMRRTIEPVARSLKRYVHIHGGFLVNLEPELAFYLAGAGLVRQMQSAGLPVCRAEIAPVEERVCQIRELYHLDLAQRLHERSAEAQPDLRGSVVTNDVDFGESGRILILTGPNQGGKTTFTQAVGLAQVLFQIGFYVPGSQARISPVDAVYTHFPLEEKPQANVGRLGEEAQRLGEIFEHATRFSLVLLNESLTTTSPGESIYLARDILRALRLWGVRAIFVTHLHELAENIEALQSSTPGDSQIASLVAGVAESGPAGEPLETAHRTYKIRPAPPMGSSFARDIARRHGISFEQLQEELKRRNTGKA